MSRVRSMLALLGALAILVAWPWGASAQVAGWSQPFEVSNTARFSWFPDLAVSNDGVVHVFWASGDPDPATPRDATKAIDLLRYRELRGGAWSETNDIIYTGKGGYTVRNSAAFGRDGRLHVLVRMNTGIYETSAPSDEAWSARGWAEPKLLSGGVAYYTALAADANNTLHAFWSEAVQPLDDGACPACSDLFYRRSTDGGETWTELQNLSYTPVGENRPQVKIDSRNRIHVVWDQGVDWYAGAGVPEGGVYRRSDDGGNTWSAPVRFTAGGRPVQQTSLAVDDAGNPLVVFRDAQNDRIYYVTSSDGGDSWGPVGEIPGVRGRRLSDNNLDTYALAADSAGRFHLLVSGFPATASAETPNPWLLHLTWDGAGWSQPAVVMGNELFPEWPRLVQFQGNQLHAVWFTRHAFDLFGSDQGAHYQIWYSNLTVEAPTVPPPPLIAPAPTATPQAAPTSPPPTPTPTPLPATTAQLPPGAPPAWELQGIQLVGMALLPVAALLALITITVVVRSRR